MTPTEWIAVGAAAGSVIGAAVGYGVVWGVSKTALNGLRKGHERLINEVKLHHENTSIHIDPLRDEKISNLIIERMDKGFARMGAILDAINKRCEERGIECQKHFASVEVKIALKERRKRNL